MNRILAFTTMLQVGAIIVGVLLAAAGIKLWDSCNSETSAYAAPRIVSWARFFSSNGAVLFNPIAIWFGVVWSDNQGYLNLSLSERALARLCLGLTFATIIVSLFPGSGLFLLTFQC